MMATFNFNVDTRPMARSLDDVSSNVAVVGTAVSAMEAAVIASERKATEKICQSIDGGFYLLMRTRLSQRVAKFTSTMSSRSGSMMETSQAIDHTHQQMLGDFNRIKARYLKLFDRLDRSLRKRIEDLDRPAMELASARQSVLAARRCQEAPAALFYASDTSVVALKASCARTKARVEDSLSELGQGARSIMDYGRTTRNVFERHTAGESVSFVPVVYAVTENQVTPDNYAFEVHTPEFLSPQTQASVAQSVRRRQQDLRGANGQEVASVRASFARKLATSGVDERVAQTMQGLFDAGVGGGGR